MGKKQTAMVVIAHPDDEAFGPSGLIAKISGKYEVHLICVTDGAADSRFHPLGKKLTLIRKKELIRSAAVLGVAKVHFLNYTDGSLCNNLYHEVAAKIAGIAKKYRPRIMITMEHRGISGHIDHAAVSLISAYVYRNNRSIDAILYLVADRKVTDGMKDYFIYFPPGYERRDADLVVDVSGVMDKKIAAAKCHVSQKKDALRITERWLKAPQEELYLVTRRRDPAL